MPTIKICVIPIFHEQESSLLQEPGFCERSDMRYSRGRAEPCPYYTAYRFFHKIPVLSVSGKKRVISLSRKECGSAWCHTQNILPAWLAFHSSSRSDEDFSFRAFPYTSRNRLFLPWIISFLLLNYLNAPGSPFQQNPTLFFITR
jgi:hypothetical protein